LRINRDTYLKRIITKKQNGFFRSLLVLENKYHYIIKIAFD